jgi:hypothetical protein
LQRRNNIDSEEGIECACHAKRTKKGEDIMEKMNIPKMRSNSLQRSKRASSLQREIYQFMLTMNSDTITPGGNDEYITTTILVPEFRKRYLSKLEKAVSNSNN